MDDKQLIKEYLSGNEDALNELINRHLKGVYNFIYRLVGNTQEAEDLAQETFLKAWKHLKKYDPDQNFKTWLFTIARNTAVDWLRRKKIPTLGLAENSETQDGIETMLGDDSPLPDELLQQEWEKDYLEKLLGRLPVHQREVTLLHHYEEMTFEEIGTLLGKPLNTVKSQYRRALLALQDLHDAPN